MMNSSSKPKFQFDHIAIFARSLEEGAEYVKDQLGIDMPQGGKHPSMGTHNLLLSLGDTEFLEVIAIDPDSPAPKRPRWFDLDNFNDASRIGTWLVGTNHISERYDPRHGEVIDMTRGDLHWQITTRADGKLSCDGAFPQLIEWPKTTRLGNSHPASRMETRDCTLVSFEISHPEASAINSFLGESFDDPRFGIVAGDMNFKATFRTPEGLKSIN